MSYKRNTMKGQGSGLWDQTHFYTGIELGEVGFGSGENVSPFLLLRGLGFGGELKSGWQRVVGRVCYGS
jgi:hypothetical protein